MYSISSHFPNLYIEVRNAMRHHIWKFLPFGVIALVTALAAACGGAAATPAPDATAPPATAATLDLQPTATPVPEASPTPAATAMPLPSGITSAQDSITLVLPEEPVALNSFGTIGASLNASVTRHNLQDPLTWQSGEDLRIVPTSATTGWEQMDADTWRFQLRQGVKFHNGEAWTQASLPSFASQGNPA